MQLNSTQHQILTINEIKLTQPPPLQNPKGEKKSGSIEATTAFAAQFMSTSH